MVHFNLPRVFIHISSGQRIPYVLVHGITSFRRCHVIFMYKVFFHTPIDEINFILSVEFDRFDVIFVL